MTTSLPPLPLWSHCLLFGVPQTSLCLSLVRILVIGFRAHPENPGISPYFKSLNETTPAETLFPNKITFTSSRGLIWISFGWSRFCLSQTLKSIADHMSLTSVETPSCYLTTQLHRHYKPPWNKLFTLCLQQNM